MSSSSYKGDESDRIANLLTNLLVGQTVSAQNNGKTVQPDYTSAGSSRGGSVSMVMPTAALQLHLSTTAPAHFPQLLAIATPGPFMFFGEVPDEIKAATEQMQLGAEFGSHLAGFDR